MLTFAAVLGLLAIYLIAWSRGYRAGWIALEADRQKIREALRICEGGVANIEARKLEIDEILKQTRARLAQVEEFLTRARSLPH